MTYFIAGLSIVAAGGAIAFFLAALGRERLALVSGPAFLLAGSALALVPAVGVLAGGGAVRLSAPWAVPGGALALRIDGLAAFFVLTVLGASSAAGIYGAGYLRHYLGKRALGPVLLFFNLLVVDMTLVVVSANAVLFLVAWELMAVFAFLLVAFEDDDAEVRSAALTYLVVTHISSSFVVAFFLLLGRETGSLDFDGIAAGTRPAGTAATVLFALAVLGFGTKAGLWPAHIWLPEAHPAAPTHVSAVMSGVIVKCAVYGLIRGLTLIGDPRPAWGMILLALGATSAVLGVLYALAQHDLKRLLAYHTIENIGIILLGLGLGFLGLALNAPALAALGFAGGLLHVFNHAVFKSLLFFGAGAVLQATGTREIERLGGLSRAMPWTAASFLVGAAAISGLPPLNGFVSEWLVYAGLLGAAAGPAVGPALAAAVAVSALALVGGLAAACFAKAFGVVFLGAARSPAGAAAHECGPSMRFAMAVLAAVCVAVGLFPQHAARVVLPVAMELVRQHERVGNVASPEGEPLARLGPEAAAAHLRSTLEPATAIGRAAALVFLCAAGLAIARRLLLAARPVGAALTWGCGYGDPSPRMQYTASSFAAPLLDLAQGVLRPHVGDHPPCGYFPGPAHRETHTPDLAAEGFFRPLVRVIARALTALRFLQQGRLQLYLLYVLVTIVALLLWQMLGGPA